MTDSPSFQVLYIAGFSRCGSTLLGSMLGQIHGFFNLGEMRMIWDRGLTEDRPCGCGEFFSACPVWSRIIRRFEGEAPSVNHRELARVGRELTRARRLPSMLLASSRNRALASERDYLATLRRLYAMVAAETRSTVLVDTSKVPMYAFTLRQAGLDVTVVHLLRDPRAVALSRLKPKRHPDTGGEMGGVSVVNSALMWSMVNWGVERILGDRQYIQIGYREFVENPSDTIELIVRALGRSGTPGLEIDDSSALLDPTHSVFGNPGRFTTGKVEIRLDDRWATELSATQTRLVEALAAPVRRRYTAPL